MTLPSPPSLLHDADIFPAGAVGYFHTCDFDELARLAPGWNQEYWQLGLGRFQGSLFMAHTSRLGVARQTCSPGIMIRGELPPGAAMIAIPLRPPGPATSRGRELRDDSALLLCPGEEIDFRTVAPFDAFVVVVAHAELDRQVTAILGCPVDELRRHEQVVIDDPYQTRHRLEALESTLRSTLLAYPAPLRYPAMARVLEDNIIRAMLVGVRVPEWRTSGAQRRHLAWRVEEYLRAHLRLPVTILELCREIGAPARTLHLAFREHFGVTPKAYLKMLMLNAVRQELRHAAAGTTVTDVAIRWNLLHFGWFAHNYREMFGETPSQTLQRSAARHRQSERSSVPQLAVFG